MTLSNVLKDTYMVYLKKGSSVSKFILYAAGYYNGIGDLPYTKVSKQRPCGSRKCLTMSEGEVVMVNNM